jgi:hypothetical protein
VSNQRATAPPLIKLTYTAVPVVLSLKPSCSDYNEVVRAAHGKRVSAAQRSSLSGINCCMRSTLKQGPRHVDAIMLWQLATTVHPWQPIGDSSIIQLHSCLLLCNSSANTGFKAAERQGPRM